MPTSLGKIIHALMFEAVRQYGTEGYSAAHDDRHSHGEMRIAAAELVVDGTDEEVSSYAFPRDSWGLVAKHGYRGTEPDPIRTLIIAGALLIREIQRIMRHSPAAALPLMGNDAQRKPAAVDAERARCANIVQECREDGDTDHRTMIGRIMDADYQPKPDNRR